MKSVLKLLLVVGAVGVTGWVVLVLLEPPIEDPLAPEVDAAGNVIDDREAFRRKQNRLRALAGVGAAPDDAEIDDASTPPDDRPDRVASLEINEQDAHAGFDYVMKDLERLGKSRRRLSKAQWRERYRRANDAFAALSNHLDGKDPEQRQVLEDAHRRLKSALAKVRVRGRKFDK